MPKDLWEVSGSFPVGVTVTVNLGLQGNENKVMHLRMYAHSFLMPELSTFSKLQNK